MDEPQITFGARTLLFVKKYRYVIGVFLVLVIVYEFVLSAPFFLKDKIVAIPDGASLIRTAAVLKNEGVIRSSIAFHVAAILFRGENSLKAGNYAVGQRDNVISLAWRIVHGDYQIPVWKITVVEGISSVEIADIFDQARFPHFDKSVFISHAKSKEGYLFPDTYFIPASSSADDVISILSSNFEKQAEKISVASSTTSHDLHSILTMASIIEGEARTDTDRKLVSGVLWKRIKIGMPLQVDATFQYINGKSSAELTRDDLTLDSPYNTYVNKGLPPGPINNPGLEAIEAAMFPTENPYLYYLSDSKGVMHYAKTFEEHVANKEKYLK